MNYICISYYSGLIYLAHTYQLYMMMFLFSVVVVAPETVTGHRGERLDIRCRYEAGYESY